MSESADNTVSPSLTTLAEEFLPARSPAGPAIATDIYHLHDLVAADFDTLVTLLRREASRPGAVGRLKALESVAAADASISETRAAVNLRALLLQMLTAIQIENADYLNAAVTAAGALNLLALEPRRKDYPFMVILGSLLYDIASLHALRGEFRQAERSIEKALKVFERLARTSPDRFGSAHTMALDKATAIYRDRTAQTELLSRYQADTTRYLQQMIEQGSPDAAWRLTRSLAAEGETLARMGRHREAMQYFTRSLKYLTRLEPDEFSLEQLRLSIALGEAMLHVAAMRDKGVHLLNTMLHKATRLGAADEHRRIVSALFHDKSRTFDILSIWHKIFPKS
ncbi:MAG: hypothetical protein K2K55_05070 [Duncaniella sp.]|nr:hypothetical protein [Duncaniella sp.]